MNKERGATLIELTIAIPVFLAFTGFLIYVVLASDERTALTQAVIKAGRAAHTRSDPAKLKAYDASGSHGLIKELDSLNNLNSPPSSVEGLFYSGVDTSVAQLLYASDGPVTGDVYGKSTASLPSTFKYQLAFVHAEMKKLLGKRVKYPCDPEGTGPNDGPGCLLCIYKNPTLLPPDSQCICEYDDIGYYCSAYSPGDCSTSVLIDDNIELHTFISCKYKPSNAVVNFVNRLMNVGGYGDIQDSVVVFERNKLLDVRGEDFVGVFGDEPNP